MADLIKPTTVQVDPTLAQLMATNLPAAFHAQMLQEKQQGALNQQTDKLNSLAALLQTQAEQAKLTDTVANKLPEYASGGFGSVADENIINKFLNSNAPQALANADAMTVVGKKAEAANKYTEAAKRGQEAGSAITVDPAIDQFLGITGRQDVEPLSVRAAREQELNKPQEKTKTKDIIYDKNGLPTIKDTETTKTGRDLLEELPVSTEPKVQPNGDQFIPVVIGGKGFTKIIKPTGDVKYRDTEGKDVTAQVKAMLGQQ